MLPLEVSGQMREPLTRKRALRTWILPCIFLLSLTSCSQQKAPCGIAQEGKQIILRQGYAIPIHPSAAEQLRFALSQFSDLGKRRAALNSVIELFPLQRTQVAEAKLELAYLSLGDDFRLAGKNDCRDAVANYESIAKQYHDLRPICAKARWYIAWIYMDLLRDKKAGLLNYQRVVSEFTNEGFLPTPHLPWQEIFAKAAKKETAFLSRKEYWGAIALLEIIRNVESLQYKQGALRQLIELYPASRAVPYALINVLEGPAVPAEAVQIAKQWLQSNNCYPPMKDYLKLRISSQDPENRQEGIH